MPLTSVWEDRHPIAADPAPATVTGEWDAVVVGAGITGLTVATLLSRAGLAVAVLEARHVGAGTTGRSTAKVSVLQGTQYSRIARRHSDSVLRGYATANAEALAWVARFCDDHEVPYQRRPAYTYATDPAGERSVRAELAALRKAGVEAAEWVDEVPLPVPTAGAVHLADQVQLDPLDLLAALRAEAVAHGATIIEGARVHRLHGHGPYTVVTEAGKATAPLVVIATNLPILDRGGFFARAEPARSYGLAYRTTGAAVDGMYLSAGSPTRSLRDAPAADGSGSVLLVGGDGHKTGASESELGHLTSLRDWTKEHFPDAVETHAWSAQDYVPHHALPFAGPILPGTDRLLFAGGYSKWGMTNGVAAALALTGRILDGHHEWASTFDPWSTHELSGVPDSIRINATVVLEMTSGWVRRIATRDDAPVCTHLGGVLRRNDAEGSWDCPLHGSRFGPDGSVLDGPATCPIRTTAG
jgi:glycine/D-amino acid oxidase-like deaminating enzyme